MEYKLDDDEVGVLKSALSVLIANNRTGELGIMHGYDRFVGSKLILKKSQREALDSVREKIGMTKMPEYRDK